MDEWSFLMNYPEDAEWAEANDVLDRMCTSTYIGLAAWHTYRARAKISLFRAEMEAQLRKLDPVDFITMDMLIELDSAVYAESLKYDVEGLDESRTFGYTYGTTLLDAKGKGWEFEWNTLKGSKVKTKTIGNGLIEMPLEKGLLGDFNGANAAGLDPCIADPINNARALCNKVVRQTSCKDGAAIWKMLCLKKACVSSCSSPIH